MRTLKLPFKLPAKFPLQVNRIEYNGETLIDLTNDTITPEDVTKGVTFHMADGTEAIGTRQNIDFLDIYPVGAIYISANDIDPSTLFGGTWEQIKDKFLLASGDSYSLGATGGEATHTLTVDEMPSHEHWLAKGESSSSPWIVGGDYTPNVNSGPFATVGSRYWWAVTKTNGGSEAHNNMPPYLTVNIWKRTA